ncbi:3-phosphoshikimate 1-carboxyvinyltransferase [Fulvivirga lutimaris]|uniref:3-phosphoshikimate 1-carboxyvinyltransferase n=1 Tax=Fulvivirga lutimaris TaxID=1819566 RepID=UPI001629B56B|nr:3-phosphoshikimate 1-carboxyvinyltransferase [Fulvivirga lutimaris]
MNSTIFIKKQSDFNKVQLSLPASKSISNRALIIDALAGGNSAIDNLSEARDTQTMIRLLASDEDILDVLDAGTTMRFLTAYLSVTNRKNILTGSDRMQNRPIGILVNALRELGAEIEYQKKDGYPPIKLNGFKDSEKKQLDIPGDISSQYISALLMIAPLLKNGLELNLTGKIGSRPYITMTLAVMKSYGVNANFEGSTVKVSPQKYTVANYSVEPDWSAASYWYSMVALSSNSSVEIKGIKLPALQGDSILTKMMTSLGVETVFNQSGATLKKINHQNEFSFDFTDCPDLAQTVAVICAAKGIKGNFTGLESLRIKETDRILALQTELNKIGAVLGESENTWTLTPSSVLPAKQVTFDTYEDHRMAMAFAPLCMLMDIAIEDPEVVNKSYPSYWEDFEKVGINLSRS